MRPTILFWGMALLCVAALLPSGSPAASPTEEGKTRIVRIATLTDFPPHCFTRDNAGDLTDETIAPGQDSSFLQGYAWDVVRESYHAAGMAVHLHVVPWSRGMHYVETGRVDVIFPAMRTPKRETKFLFSEEPVIRSSFIVYVPLSSKIEWNGLSSLSGRRIVGVKGWAFGKEWESDRGIIKMEAYSILQGFEMVRNGWVSGIAGYDVPFDYVLKENGLAGEFRKLPSWGVAEEYVMGSKHAPRTMEFLTAFDEGKRSIEEAGFLKAIQAKWR